MKKKVIATTILVGAVLVGFLVVHLAKVYDRQLNYHKTATYHIYADRLDLKSVNSYPQKISKILKKGDYFELILKVSPAEVGSVTARPRQGKLEAITARYLQATDKIQSNSKEVRELATKLAKKSSSIHDIAQAVSKWTSSNISYDSELAFRFGNGISETQGARETIESKSGTCYESSNVFAAVMRSVGVPTKYVVGHVFGEAYLAWAEYYVDGQWVSVDPSTGDVGLDNRYIKLYEGLEYPEFKVMVSDIGIGVDRLE